jgi:hypothetical protein
MNSWKELETRDTVAIATLSLGVSLLAILFVVEGLNVVTGLLTVAVAANAIGLARRIRQMRSGAP